jgi:hypothetical protein
VYRSGVKCSWVKCSEGLSNRVSNIVSRYIAHMKFAAYVVLSFIPFFHVLLVPFFVSLYIWLYVLYASVYFCKLCISIVMFMYSYCYVCSVVYSVFTVLFYVLFVCKYVLYYCHRVSTQLQLTNKSNICGYSL